MLKTIINFLNNMIRVNFLEEILKIACISIGVLATSLSGIYALDDLF